MLGRILLTVGGVTVVALFAALLAPFFIDWSDFRMEFEQRASRILGKKVAVHGAVDARILPFPSVTLHDVRVGRDLDGQPQLQAARFSMDMELAPFLSGEARIFDMRVEEPKARIRILEDGTLDWMRGSSADIPARTVVIEDVHVTDGAVELIDERSGRVRHLTGLAADLSAGSLAGPWRGDGHASLDGQEASFTISTGEVDRTEYRVPLRLRLLPDAALVALNLDGALALSEERPEYTGKFTVEVLQEEDETEPVEAPPPGPRLGGGFELTNDRIRVPEYRLELGPLNDPYVVTGEATLDTGENPEFLLTAEGQQIDVNRLGEGARAKTGRNAAASAQRRIQAVIDLAAQIPIPQVPGRASLSLPAIVANGTTVRDIRMDVRPAGLGWTVDNFAATLPGRTQVEAKGTLTLADQVSFVGDMLLASNQPSGLADWLSGTIDPAIRRLKTAGFSASVNLTQELQSFDDLELAVGPATLRGSVERHAASAATPSLTVDLAGDEIDLDAIRALASLMTGKDAGQDVLDHTVAARLKADRLIAFGVAADSVDTVFTLADGELALERLSIGDVAGASVTATGRVTGSLLDYGGSGHATFRAGDPSRFIAMLRDRLPRHPLLDRLSGSASWFADTNINADITIGGDTNGIAVGLSGRTNGSALSADLAMPTLFELTAQREFSLSGTLENDDGATLLGQAGLDPLPLGNDGVARLAFDVSQRGGDPALLNLAYNTERTDMRAQGHVSLAAEGFGSGDMRLSVDSENIEPYLLMNGIGLPQFGRGLPVRLAADLAVSPAEIRLGSIDAVIAGNAMAGDLVLDRMAPGPAVQGELHLDTLDLAWLAEAAYGTLTDPLTGGLSQKPFSLPIFGAVDARLQVVAKTFRPGIFGNVTDFKALLLNRNGGVTIEEASGDWMGGRLSGRLMMANGEETGIFQTRLQVEDAELTPLLWQQEGVPAATGRVDVVLAAETTAQSASGLLDALNGSGELTLRDLSLNGIDPAALPAILSEADAMTGDIAAETVRPVAEPLIRRGSTPLGTVALPFTITDGEVRAQNVVAIASGTTLAGEVRIDLLEEVLTGNIAITYDAGGDATVHLRYFGDLAAPATELDVAPLANFLSVRAFERERRRVEALQASVMEKQRLRREVMLYRFLDAERQAAREKAEAEERALREAEERRQAEEALAEVERQRAESAARAVEAERQREQQQRQEQVPILAVPPIQDVFREPLSPLDRPAPQGLPGVR